MYRLLFPPVINPVQIVLDWNWIQSTIPSSTEAVINSGADDQIRVGIQLHSSLKRKRRESLQRVLDSGEEQVSVIYSRICETRVSF